MKKRGAKKAVKRRRCGQCNKLGHNVRTCPALNTL